MADASGTDHGVEEEDPSGEIPAAIDIDDASVPVPVTFEDLKLKPELVKALEEYGFVHPREVQSRCVPPITDSKDVLCIAPNGAGKSVAIAMATMQNFEPEESKISMIVICSTRTKANQVAKYFKMFSKHLSKTPVNVALFCGGRRIRVDKNVLSKAHPDIVVGTCGRIMQLLRQKSLNLKDVTQFVVHECGSLLEQPERKEDLMEMFRNTPHEKQVLMFTRCLDDRVRPLCRWFFKLGEPTEINLVGDEESAEQNDMKGDIDVSFDMANLTEGGPVPAQSSPTFNDLYLKPEIIKAVEDLGFKHPTEVQCRCIPLIVNGENILCQGAKRSGKSTALVLGTLQNFEPEEGKISLLVICTMRVMADNIASDYRHLSRHMYPTPIKVGVFRGGTSADEDMVTLRNERPHIVVGTLGRLLSLQKNGILKLNDVKMFATYECFQIIGQQDTRKDFMQVFRNTPRLKQVLMFTSKRRTKELMDLCAKFFRRSEQPIEINLIDEKEHMAPSDVKDRDQQTDMKRDIDVSVDMADLTEEVTLRPVPVQSNSTFEDLNLKPEIIKAVEEVGYEHPTEVQCRCIPLIVDDQDIICASAEGSGKSTALILGTLQKFAPEEGKISLIVICVTRLMADNIASDYRRLSRHMYPTPIKVCMIRGGASIHKDEDTLRNECPHIVVGTLGRMLALQRNGALNLNDVKVLATYECFQIIHQPDSRNDFENVFNKTPHTKQVLMFTSERSTNQLRPMCAQFFRSQQPSEINLIDDEKSDEAATDVKGGGQKTDNDVSVNMADLTEGGPVPAQSNTTFKDLNLKPEIIKAVEEVGYEHPTEVQCRCIPLIIDGKDILCKGAKGSGKRTALILGTLQNFAPEEGKISLIVICHSRRFADNIACDYRRLSKHMNPTPIKVCRLSGGPKVDKDAATLRNERPHIVVGTLGRLLDLQKNGTLKLNDVKVFATYECAQMINPLGLATRTDFEQLFKATPHRKQVLMFTSEKSTKQLRPLCGQFFRSQQHPEEIDHPATKGFVSSSIPKYNYASTVTCTTSTSFKDLELKPEIVRALKEEGHEYATEVQRRCIPLIVNGQDVLCEAEEDSGKSTALVLGTLQNFEPEDDKLTMLAVGSDDWAVMKMAINYGRFASYMGKYINVLQITGKGGLAKIRMNLRNESPHIVVGTVSRLVNLVREGALNVSNVKVLAAYNCGQILQKKGSELKILHEATNSVKQVIMFSSGIPGGLTLQHNISMCSEFFKDRSPAQVFIDDDEEAISGAISEEKSDITDGVSDHPPATSDSIPSHHAPTFHYEDASTTACSASTFKDLKLKPELVQALEEEWIEHPTEVQCRCIPFIVSGRDILCEADKDSGKGMALIMASLQQCLTQVEGKITLLLVCPELESCLRMAADLEHFSRNLFRKRLRVTVCHGHQYGGKREFMLEDERPHVVVGTLAKLMNLTIQHVLDLSEVKLVAAYGCASILKKEGRRRHFEEVCQRCSDSKQVIIFNQYSNLMGPDRTKAMCEKFFESETPVYINCSVAYKSMFQSNAQHYFINLREYEKETTLVNHLDLLKTKKVLIYVDEDWKCEAIALTCGTQAFYLCDSMPEEERTAAIKKLHKLETMETGILVVAKWNKGADFLDPARFDVVINYDMPDNRKLFLYLISRVKVSPSQRGITITLVVDDELRQFLTMREHLGFPCTVSELDYRTKWSSVLEMDAFYAR